MMAEHELFVLSRSSDPDLQAKTHKILKYVLNVLPELNALGVTVRPVKVPVGSLSNPSIKAALKSRGVVKFPTLITSGGATYVGYEEISGIYDTNIGAFKKSHVASRNNVTSPEDELADFYRNGMAQEAGGDDSLDDQQDTKNMMSKVNKFKKGGGQDKRSEKSETGRIKTKLPASKDKRFKSPSTSTDEDENMGGGMSDMNGGADEDMFKKYWENQEPSD